MHCSVDARCTCRFFLNFLKASCRLTLAGTAFSLSSYMFTTNLAAILFVYVPSNSKTDKSERFLNNIH